MHAGRLEGKWALIGFLWAVVICATVLGIHANANYLLPLSFLFPLLTVVGIAKLAPARRVTPLLILATILATLVVGWRLHEPSRMFVSESQEERLGARFNSILLSPADRASLKEFKYDPRVDLRPVARAALDLLHKSTPWGNLLIGEVEGEGGHLVPGSLLRGYLYLIVAQEFPARHISQLSVNNQEGACNSEPACAVGPRRTLALLVHPCEDGWRKQGRCLELLDRRALPRMSGQPNSECGYFVSVLRLKLP